MRIFTLGDSTTPLKAQGYPFRSPRVKSVSSLSFTKLLTHIGSEQRETTAMETSDFYVEQT